MKMKSLNAKMQIMALCLFSLALQLYGQSSKFKSMLSTLTNPQILQNLNWNDVIDLFPAGNLNGYFDSDETLLLMQSLYKTYKDKYIFSYKSIGKTLQGRDIMALGVSQPKAQGKNVLNQRILLTGNIEGDDLITTQMSLLLVIKLIHGGLQSDNEILYYLAHREVWFIPCLNFDTLVNITNIFNEDPGIGKTPKIISKNMRDTYQKTLNGAYEYCEFATGVDLKCNFGYMFNDSSYSNSGIQACNAQPCNPSYRGSAAFSEPESEAFLAFLQSINPSTLTIQYFGAAVNFNTQALQSNAILLPYNYYAMSYADQAKLNNDDILAYPRDKYNVIIEELPNSQAAMLDTRYAVFGSTIDGDISDFILQNMSTISLNVHLGSPDITTNAHFPTLVPMKDILRQNINSSLYFILKAGDLLHFSPTVLIKCSSQIQQCLEQAPNIYNSVNDNLAMQNLYYFEASLKNTGMGPTPNSVDVNIRISLKSCNNYFQVNKLYIKQKIYQGVWPLQFSDVGFGREKVAVSDESGTKQAYVYTYRYSDVINNETEFKLAMILQKNTINFGEDAIQIQIMNYPQLANLTYLSYRILQQSIDSTNYNDVKDVFSTDTQPTTTGSNQNQFTVINGTAYYGSDQIFQQQSDNNQSNSNGSQGFLDKHSTETIVLVTFLILSLVCLIVCLFKRIFDNYVKRTTKRTYGKVRAPSKMQHKIKKRANQILIKKQKHQLKLQNKLKKDKNNEKIDLEQMSVIHKEEIEHEQKQQKGCQLITVQTDGNISQRNLDQVPDHQEIEMQNIQISSQKND